MLRLPASWSATLRGPPTDRLAMRLALERADRMMVLRFRVWGLPVVLL